MIANLRQLMSPAGLPLLLSAPSVGNPMAAYASPRPGEVERVARPCRLDAALLGADVIKVEDREEPAQSRGTGARRDNRHVRRELSARRVRGRFNELEQCPIHGNRNRPQRCMGGLAAGAAGR